MRKEDVFLELEQHLLEDAVPSEYLKQMMTLPIMKREPFYMLYKMKQTNQSPVYHAEGNVWNHTLMVVDEAAKKRDESKNVRAFMWAAFLHDIGKPVTTKVRNGKITSYNHDIEGEKLAREFLRYFIKEEELIESVCGLVRCHMQKLYQKKGYASNRSKKKNVYVDKKELELLWVCDRLGRIMGKSE